jgi:hypothetical protein
LLARIQPPAIRTSLRLGQFIALTSENGTPQRFSRIEIRWNTLEHNNFEALWQHHTGRSGAMFRAVAAMTAGKRIAFRRVITVSGASMARLRRLRWWSVPSVVVPGPVEIGVSEEIDGLAAQARPGLAQAALALARILDNPKAVNQQPAAAKVLISMLEKLRSASPAGRRGLAVVRELTKKG